MQNVAKRSRFVVESKGVPFRLTRSDMEIIGPLQTYKYLPSTHLIRFASGLHPQYVKNRLTILRHEAKIIDCPASSWHAANARYRPAVYQLTEKGRAALHAHGLTRPTYPTSEEFKHEFGASIVAASFAIGALEQPDIAFHDHEVILNSRFCPSSTRDLKTPFKIPVSFVYHYQVGEEERHTKLDTFVKHDWRPFGFTNRMSRRSQFFFPGIEFDRHTESLGSSDYNASTIQRHIQSARALASEDGYASHYGIPNAFIPWVTISEARMHSIMREVEKATGGRGSKRFLFKTIPDFSSFESFPPADGAMLTTPWKRVGYPDFDILRELGVK